MMRIRIFACMHLLGLMAAFAFKAGDYSSRPVT